MIYRGLNPFTLSDLEEKMGIRIKTVNVCGFCSKTIRVGKRYCTPTHASFHRMRLRYGAPGYRNEKQAKAVHEGRRKHLNASRVLPL